MLIRYAIRWRPIPNVPPMFLAGRPERGGLWVTIDGDMKTWGHWCEASHYLVEHKETLPDIAEVAKIDLVDMKEIA